MGDIGTIRQRYDVLAAAGSALGGPPRVGDHRAIDLEPHRRANAAPTATDPSPSVPSPEPMPAPYPAPVPEPSPTAVSG